MTTKHFNVTEINFTKGNCYNIMTCLDNLWIHSVKKGR